MDDGADLVPLDVVPRGRGGPNPLQLHPEELAVLRCLGTSKIPLEVDDPVWDELEALGFVEMYAQTRPFGATPARVGILTSLGRRYRFD